MAQLIKLLKELSEAHGAPGHEEEVKKLLDTPVEITELEKVKNKVESMISFEDLGLLSRANNLAFYELLGDAERMNREFEHYNKVTVADIQRMANIVFDEKNSNTLYYLAKGGN